MCVVVEFMCVCWRVGGSVKPQQQQEPPAAGRLLSISLSVSPSHPPESTPNTAPILTLLTWLAPSASALKFSGRKRILSCVSSPMGRISVSITTAASGAAVAGSGPEEDRGAGEIEGMKPRAARGRRRRRRLPRRPVVILLGMGWLAGWLAGWVGGWVRVLSACRSQVEAR